MQTWYLKDFNTRTYPVVIQKKVFNEETLQYIDSVLTEEIGEQAVIYTDTGVAIDHSIRSTTISFLKYDNDKLQDFYRTIVDLVNNVNNFNYNYRLTHIEQLQYGVYDSSTKDRYDYHQDGEGTFDHNNRYDIRKLSFSILLDRPGIDFTGGDFVYKIQKEDTKINYDRGDIVFFPSWTLHKVNPVVSGTRRSIVGWVRGPHWI